MKEEFAKYLQAISLSSVLTARVDSINEFYTGVCPEEIKWMFVSDYFTKEGERVFASVCLFSDHFAMESKEFPVKEDLDFARIEDIYYFEIKKQDYDMKRSTDKSRLNVQISFAPRLSLNLKASKENCDYLWAFFHEYVLPRVKGK